MSSLQNSNVIAAAVGATIGVVSVAAVFIYHKVMERQQHSTMNSNIDRVSRKVVELQAELEALRVQQANLQKSRRKKVIKRRVYSDDNTLTEDVDIDTFSTAGTDIGDDEFYDCSSDEESVANGTIAGGINSELMELDKEIEDISLRPGVYTRLKKLYQENPDNIEVIWRFSKAAYYCSLLEPNKKDDYINEGLEALKKVLHIQNGDLYKWYAILLGVKSKDLPTKERIKTGYMFKEYLEKALELLPNDNFLYHLLGRFQYEVAHISWIERKVAATIFAEVPEGTCEEALKCFETAERLGTKPHWENKLFLGKTYIAVKKPEEAVKYLAQLKDIPILTSEDQEIRDEARSLLKNYSKYYYSS